MQHSPLITTATILRAHAHPAVSNELCWHHRVAPSHAEAPYGGGRRKMRERRCLLHYTGSVSASEWQCRRHLTPLGRLFTSEPLNRIKKNQTGTTELIPTFEATYFSCKMLFWLSVCSPQALDLPDSEQQNNKERNCSAPLNIGEMHLMSAGCFTLQRCCFSLCCAHNQLQGKKHSVDESANPLGAERDRRGRGGEEGWSLQWAACRWEKKNVTCAAKNSTAVMVGNWLLKFFIHNYDAKDFSLHLELFACGNQ